MQSIFTPILIFTSYGVGETNQGITRWQKKKAHKRYPSDKTSCMIVLPLTLTIPKQHLVNNTTDCHKLRFLRQDLPILLCRDLPIDLEHAHMTLVQGQDIDRSYHVKHHVCLKFELIHKKDYYLQETHKAILLSEMARSRIWPSLSN